MTVIAISINFTSNDNYTNRLIFIIATSTLFRSMNVIDFYFQSKVLSKYVVIVNIFSLFISSIIKIVLIVISAPLIAFAWVILIDGIIIALDFLYFYLHMQLSIKQWKFDKTIAVSLVKDGLPLLFGGIAI